MKKLVLLFMLVLMLTSCTRDRGDSNYTPIPTSNYNPSRLELSSTFKGSHPGKTHILNVGDSINILVRTCETESEQRELSLASISEKTAVFYGLNPESQLSGVGGTLTNKPYCGENRKLTLAVYVTEIAPKFVEVYVYTPSAMGVVDAD